MKVTDLYVYPIKSCQGIRLSQAEVKEKGFLWDREFMLVNQEGIFLTQRDYPLLATIKVNLEGDCLYLSSNHNQLSPLKLTPISEGKELKVQVWRSNTKAIDQGEEVAEWFNEVLQLSGTSKCRLVKQSSRYPRKIDSKYSFRNNQAVSFADGYPFLLTATASLDDLNRRLQEKYPDQNQQVPMNRFRPNIVIETNEPFMEGQWKSIKIGEVKFRLVKPCSRCVVTTTDQNIGKVNELKEPLATLSSFRRFRNQGVMFGENMIPESLGMIKVGDEVVC